MLQNVIDQLVEFLGEEKVLTQKEDLICYAYDATADLAPQLPWVVVCPSNRDEVVGIMKIAAKNKVPIYTRGAGTNLSGGTVPQMNGIVVSMLEMNKILEIDADNLTATVEPGVVIQWLLDEAEKYGLMYPPDPGTVKTATMGGSVAECSGGLRGLKYGVTKDYVMGIEAVLADGSVVEFGGKTMKNVSGYNMVSLFTGSEGTLGIITKIIVRLVPIPEYRYAMMAVYSDLDKAANTIKEIIAHKIIPCTLEIMDNITVRTVEDYLKIGLPVDAQAILLIEMDGMKESVIREAEQARELCIECGADDVRVAKDDEERDRLWEARRAALPALVRARPTTILEDATVPRSRIPEMIRAITGIAEKYGIAIGTFGHAGDGNLHPTILTDESNTEEMERVHKAIGEIFETAISLGGTLSGEHGIGISKAGYMKLQFSETELELLKRIKAAFDPNNLLNPGKIFVQAVK